jgi:Na+-translocating ferredoxin:NAD+ oxidoreductase RnfC subunit
MMERWPEKIVDGLKIAMELTGAHKGYIGLKKKYSIAVRELSDALEKEKNDRIELFTLDNFYPAGDEQVLVYEILHKIIPEGGIPLDVGVVVNNVGTLAQISEAVEGKSVTQRWVTITGAVKEPQTRRFPIGTPLSKAIESAGGTSLNTVSVITGGPMMGKLVSSMEDPITKTTSGIIVLPEDHYVVRSKKRPPRINIKYTISACIQCQMCTDVCPRRNLGKFVCPDKVMKGIAYGIISESSHMTTSFLCVECGVCTHYGCPMGLDPCGMMGKTKKELAAAGLNNPHDREGLRVNEFRDYRKIPVKRLISRLGLAEYDRDAPMNDSEVKVNRVTIPLKQHIGAPAISVIKVGDKVERGQIIATIPDSALSANYHASISGIITNIKNSITIESDE